MNKILNIHFLYVGEPGDGTDMFLKVFMNHLVNFAQKLSFPINQHFVVMFLCKSQLYLAVDIESADSKEPIQDSKEPIPAKKWNFPLVATLERIWAGKVIQTGWSTILYPFIVNSQVSTDLAISNVSAHQGVFTKTRSNYLRVRNYI